MALTKEDLKQGKTYRGKRFVENLGGNNDRVIIRLWDNTLQYDSDTVGFGKHYPTVTIEKFLKWAKEEAPTS